MLILTLMRCIFFLQTSAQQALTGTINSSMQAVQAAQASLDDFDTLPPLGTDAVSFTFCLLGKVIPGHNSGDCLANCEMIIQIADFFPWVRFIELCERSRIRVQQ